MGEQVTRVTSLSALSCNSKARKLALCLSSAGNVGRRAGNERSGCSRGESRESEREDCGLHDEMMFLVFPLPREFLAEPKEWTVVPSGVGWPSPLLYNFLAHRSRALPRRKSTTRTNDTTPISMPMIAIFKATRSWSHWAFAVVQHLHMHQRAHEPRMAGEDPGQGAKSCISCTLRAK